MSIGVLRIGSQRATPFITFGDNANTMQVSGNTPSITLDTNTVYNCTDTLTSLILNFPVATTDFVCEVDFTTGNSFSEITPSQNISWFGVDVNEWGNFNPEPNTTYKIVIYFDGRQYRGLIGTN
jgi:hypothetical protein